MNRILLFVGLFLAAYLLLGTFGPAEKLPEISLEMTNANYAADCTASTQRCVLVYAAPWCPACKASVPVINELYQYVEGSEGKVGMRAIVGQDQRPKLEQFAERLRLPVYFDELGEFSSQVQMSGVPTWFVIDRERNILVSIGGTRGGSLQGAVEHMIDKDLGLSDYM